MTGHITVLSGEIGTGDAMTDTLSTNEKPAGRDNVAGHGDARNEDSRLAILVMNQ